MLSKVKRQDGFTIIELLIVIAIIGVLALLVVTNFGPALAKGRDTNRQNDIASLSKALEIYHSNNGNYPGEALTTTILEGIENDALDDEDGNQIAIAISSAATVPGDPYATDYTNNTTPSGAQYTYSGYDCTSDTAASGETCEAYIIHAWSEVEDAGPSFSETSLNQPTN